MTNALLLLMLLSAQPVVPAKDSGGGGGPPDRSREPFISEVQKAAARQAGFDLEKAASWKKNAGRAAWLPVFTVRVKKENFSNDGSKYGTDTPYEVITFNDGIYFEFIAQWDLEKLVFRREEMDAQRENAAVFESYRRLMEEVGRLFYRRRLLVEELTAKELSSEQRFEKNMQMEEATALLDALTGGYFSRAASGGNGHHAGGGVR
jgi:myosin-crossreactive antigen